MKRLLIGMASAAALMMLPVSALAETPSTLELPSQVYIGPGGVQIGPGHSRWRSPRRYGSEDRHSRWRSDQVATARECRRLRRSCEAGEGGCGRYRRLCR